MIGYKILLTTMCRMIKQPIKKEHLILIDDSSNTKVERQRATTRRKTINSKHKNC